MLPRVPAPWTPPPAPALTGALAPNARLQGAELWAIPGGAGPEDVAIGPDGAVYAGVLDGRILRFVPGPAGEPPQVSVVANTGGRPLGVEVAADGSLCVCDAHRGLLRVEPREGAEGLVTLLVGAYEGRRLRFANNCDVAPDGRVYFSDSSTEWTLEEYRADLLEHRAYGRLLCFDPSTGRTALVCDGFHFANGVALTHDGSAALVAETACYRVWRVELEGARRGHREPLLENMPGFPDNLSRAPSGRFWAPLPTLRNRALDRLLPHPRVRRLVSALPETLQPQPTRYGLVLGFDEQGRVHETLHDPTGRVAMVTGAREADGWLVLGSLSEPHVARVRL
jgi:sugar lactone lactonase YvrE